MEFRELSTSYEDTREIFTLWDPGSRRSQQLEKLCNYMNEHATALSADLNQNPEHSLLYRDIKSLGSINVTMPFIKKIEIRAEILRSQINEQFKNCLNTKNPQELIDVRRQIKDQFQPYVDRQLLSEIAALLNLKGKKLADARPICAATCLQMEALAAWIDLNKISLAKLKLSAEELTAIAPFLHYADLRGLKDQDQDRLLPLCIKAHQLLLDSITITELKELPPNLEVLECRCSALTRISLTAAPRLQDLDCHDCTALTTLELPETPLLCSVQCHGCVVLTSLIAPHTPQLELFNGNSCISLPALSLPYTPKLDRLSCSVCVNLRTVSLPFAPLLKDINLSDCERLQTIESEGFPNCSRFDCSDSPSITNFPQMPPTAAVLTRDSMQFNSFPVRPDKLEQNPRSVLLDLGTILLANKPFPNVVWWDLQTNAPAKGMDAGGLRAQLVTTLCENLFKEGSQFPFTHVEGGKLPLLRDLQDIEDVTALRTLARLIACCSTSELLLGEDLPHSFFYTICSILNDQLDYSKPLLNKIYLNLLGLWNDELNLHTNLTNHSETLNNPDRFSIALPVALIANELKSIPHFSLNRLRCNPDGFIKHVKGTKVTKEAFLDRLSCEAAMKMFFERFITENPHKLTDLVELFTSSRTLGDQPIEISIKPSLDSAALPLIHTCTKVIDMPAYPTYEIFRQKLTLAFETLKTFENI